MFVLLGIFLIFVFLITGLVLCFYKRTDLTLSPVQQPRPVWLKTLSPSAQAVHVSEWDKKTATKFTAAWFLEYWQGKRSAFYAWFVWSFLVGIIFRVSDHIILHYTAKQYHIFLTVLFGLVGIIHITVGSIILWRCAANSRVFLKYFARFYAILPGIVFVAALLYLFF